MRYSGGKVITCTTEDLVSLININDDTYLKYQFPELCSFIRGTYADEAGTFI